ncbi:Zn-dependent hydrolase [Mesobacillus subterraneus]|uniref:Allantoate amidohydrolase n=1 Tax=Mesobacillus subterraneus TaxID=285983 RepID=A0A0D6ZAI2_9BACI|nr:Zn-dependent hydrolase [Mesobacillus subterraneus]KIY22527.1 allantoate amidohydrolase [Mesobacillus subterraneus]
MVNPNRLWERLQKLSAIGATENGGVTRLSFTKEEREAKKLVASFMKEAGLSVREDEVGNLIGRREGISAGAPAVLTGSHIDSVYDGGNFDGPLGVIAAIEAVQTFEEEGIATEHPIEVIVFTDEEGARFSFGMIGSRGLAGILTREELENQDRQGKSIAEAMAENGMDPEKYKDAARKKGGDVKAYIEVHIEQGKVLEREGLSVGVVSGLAGPLWLKFTVDGEAGHAGNTPMVGRHDAMVAASKMIVAIEEEVKRIGSTVGTVGQLQIFPGGINIIPGKVEFSLDLRDINEETRDKAEQAILQRSKAIAEEHGVRLSVEDLQRIPPAPCSKEIQQAATEVLEENGMRAVTLPSGAGHDGMQFTNFCPIGMLFVRSKGGISHDPAEWSSKEDCADGAKVLCGTLKKLAVATFEVKSN